MVEAGERNKRMGQNKTNKQAVIRAVGLYWGYSPFFGHRFLGVPSRGFSSCLGIFLRSARLLDPFLGGRLHVLLQQP